MRKSTNVKQDEKVYNVGILMGSPHMPHSKELLDGFYAASEGEQVNLTMFLGTQGNLLDYLSDLDDDDKENFNYQVNTVYDYALLGGVDALIVSFDTMSIFLDRISRQRFFKRYESFPAIILGIYDEDSDDYNIISDNYSGIGDIMRHLLEEHGYRKIVHLSGPDDNQDAAERKQAYLDWMAKYDIPVTEEMMVKGDYSAQVDELVGYLLEHNEGVEAIVCGNDDMASSAYRECKRRGLVVGKDIAITGYDDFEMACRMDPPLTTINQDAFEMGYLAVKKAIALCKGEEVTSFRVASKFRKRSSCGCSFCENKWTDEYVRAAKERPLLSIEEIARRAMDHIVVGCRAGEKDSIFEKLFCDLFTTMLEPLRNDSNDLVYDAKAIEKKMIHILRSILADDISKYVDGANFSNFIYELLKFELRRSEEKEKAILIYRMIGVVNEYIQSLITRRRIEETDDLTYKVWKAPIMLREMMEQVGSEKRFYTVALEQLKKRGAKSAFLYKMDTPKNYHRGERFRCPAQLFLTAQYVDGEIRYFPESKRPFISKDEGIARFYDDGGGNNYGAFVLFAEETQFGILVCEMEHDVLRDLFGISLQIGTAMAYFEMSKREEDAKRKLYNNMKMIQDKNKVLSFVSSKDELTGIYNRRGFMEQALIMTKQHEGEKAYMIFADMDHLKEVNDCFGHTEGDFAIKNMARVISEAVNDIGFCGRIGGDEFVAMAISEDENFEENLRSDITARMKQLNDTSGKPYYVEFSVGVEEFICEADCELSVVLRRADNVLYEAKKSRRTSIKREA